MESIAALRKILYGTTLYRSQGEQFGKGEQPIIKPRGAYRQQRSYHFAICLKEDPAPIGYISVGTDDSHDLGYGLRREFWRRGLVTEAGRAVTIPPIDPADAVKVSLVHPEGDRNVLWLPLLFVSITKNRRKKHEHANTSDRAADPAGIYRS